MALIKDSNPKKVSGGYTRIFGNEQLGFLMSRVQSAVISSGNELEKIVRSRVNEISNLDDFLNYDIMPEGVFVAHKSAVKKCSTLDFAGAEPDFIVFKRRDGKQQCHIIELKDGDTFDTKKSSGEHRSMHEFIAKNAPRLRFIITTHFCCFNQNNRKEIVKGFKGKISSSEAMSGIDFCNLLEIDWHEIVELRKRDSAGNVNYFLSELIKIDTAKKWLKDHFG